MFKIKIFDAYDYKSAQEMTDAINEFLDSMPNATVTDVRHYMTSTNGHGRSAIEERVDILYEENSMFGHAPYTKEQLDSMNPFH